MRISDWSSDVCSSDLLAGAAALAGRRRQLPAGRARAAGLPRAAPAGPAHRRRPGDGHRGAAVDSRIEPLRRRARRRARTALRLRLALRAGPAPRSEEHTSELQSLMRISYAVFCLKKKIVRYNIYISKHTYHSLIQHTK